jgi:hypothetical protein
MTAGDGGEPAIGSDTVVGTPADRRGNAPGMDFVPTATADGRYGGIAPNNVMPTARYNGVLREAISQAKSSSCFGFIYLSHSYRGSWPLLRKKRRNLSDGTAKNWQTESGFS